VFQDRLKGYIMRVTSSSYYNNVYGENNKLNQQLFDVNKQISSTQKIQYSYENPNIFIDTLRLDDEITTLTQSQSSAQIALKMSTQTDTTIGDFVKNLDNMKMKLVNAASQTNSDASLKAIAKELRGIQSNLMTLANTSSNGQYLFSGTAISQKPIDQNGVYQGNDKDLEAFLGSGVKQKFNISGTQLFLGNESNINRTVSTNISQLNLTELYPDIMKSSATPRSDKKDVYVTADNTIRDLMGVTDTDTSNNTDRKAYFYIQGTRTNGETFKQKIDIKMDASINDLLLKVSDSFSPNQVDVTLNKEGQIEIVDKNSGSSKLDFHIVGATDFGSDGIDNADTTNLSTLQSGTTNFEDVLSGTNSLYIKEFVKSGLAPADSTAKIQGLVYDQANFSQDGAKLISNVSQIINTTNEFATESTKLEDVSGSNNMSGRVMGLKGKDVDGNLYDISIRLGSPSTFTNNLSVPTPTTYNIYGVKFNDLNTNTIKEAGEGIPSNANEVTYRQLMDVVNMAITGNLPATDSTINNPADYDQAIQKSNYEGKVSLTSDGKIVFEDLQHSTTNAELSLSDTTSNSFFPPLVMGNALNFQTNSALTLRDPKTNFFDEIEQIIQSVETGSLYSNGNNTKNPFNIGIKNSIQMVDDLSTHIGRLQTESGSYSQVLQASSDRSELLIVSTKMLQSDVIDVDIAESQLKLQQLSLSYQAMLSTISKVSKLSLVNYL
jgi:flagellar hook-associated protein 3 FlgL